MIAHRSISGVADVTGIEHILITGSSGLVGCSLRRALASFGYTTVGLDIKGHGRDYGDIRNRSDVRRAIKECSGIVHLAAVSRVVWGEVDPGVCWATNVDGLSVVIDEAERSKNRPWIIFASSREVYGEPDSFPVTEDAPLRPMNIYGQSKAQGEIMLAEAATRGVRTCVVRLSNVYGSTADYCDRVVPAFARTAVTGGRIRIDGGENSFDFTHLDDTVEGLVAVIRHHQQWHRSKLPTIQFVTGKSTTLNELASLAIQLGGGRVSTIESAPRKFDVANFVGSHERASAILGWSPRVHLRDGLERLITEFQSLERSVATCGEN